MWQPNTLAATTPGLTVSQWQEGGRLVLLLQTDHAADCVLHWGLTQRAGGPWRCPPAECRPAGTTTVDAHAARTPFVRTAQGRQELRVELELPCRWRHLVAVLHCPKDNRWYKNGTQDFTFALPYESEGFPGPEEALAKWVTGEGLVRQTFPLDSGDRLAAAVRVTPAAAHIYLACDASQPVLLHWGLAPRFRHQWLAPPSDCRPAGSTLVDQALRTPFTPREGVQWLELELPLPADRPRGVRFVLFQPDDRAWIKSGGKDLYLPLTDGVGDARLPTPALRSLADEIIDAEVGASSWTLMHRFHLCHDLLGKAADDDRGLALLFAWLRYSAIRQLDWQRHYNTKPRELAHAQDRLTCRLAGLWKHGRPEVRLWARLMLTTLGRGADGQRVRDEILHIMHRNHLKEVSGNFVEEWHQKLHNNTTPDDIPICEAYLAFLHNNGDTGLFYRTLEEKGVTRDRLRSFERPIKTDPHFYADRRDALIREFNNFLNILKAVHAGTDLGSAAQAARRHLGGEANRKLDAVFAQQNAAVQELAATIVELREDLGRALNGMSDAGALRDVLYLDLALEEALRVAIERQALSRFDRDPLVDLVERALRNLAASAGDEELSVVARDWAALRQRPRDGREWALHARGVAERAGRWVQCFTDQVYSRLQPLAETLGEAFGVPAWVVTLFSEEVVRGGPAFPLALLLRHLDPILRRSAGLGGWQVISPGRAAGRVRVCDSLLAVQHEQFAEATILLADRVTGEEEIAPGVTAVITRDTPDLVSHVAVRARIARVLFATCFDDAVYQRLRGLVGHTLALQATSSGHVEHHEGATADASAEGGTGNAARKLPLRAPRSAFRAGAASPWVVQAREFTAEVVGGKSNNLNGLRGRLPADIGLPVSLAVPFGVCEGVLADPANGPAREQYGELVRAAEGNPAAVLPRLRSLITGLEPPADLREALLAAWREVGLPPVPWEQAWHGIRRVWASKWNDRAFYSRRACGLPHDELLMAVLIQQVIEADYAFVIHTTNPATGHTGELYAEVVLGLGETLVGNYPGRALGFVYHKTDQRIEVVSSPSKSVGLYGKGVIFRSDSNGEDLEGFAGAGLYDSVLAEEPRRQTLSYAHEPLVWDGRFRDDLLRRIARVGLEVERLLGAPQDIEGAVAGGRLYVVQTRPQVGLDSQ